MYIKKEAACENSEKDSKMSTLKKIQDENRESKFGYVYAVSGPGKKRNKWYISIICKKISTYTYKHFD